jgi:hypothetical protein
MFRYLKTISTIVCVAALTIGCGKKSNNPIGPSTGGSSVPIVQTITIGGASGASALAVGQTRQLKASAGLTDGSEYDITLLATWSSDDAGVATVTPTGMVTATGAGTGRIRAAYQQASGITTFNIAEDPSTGSPSGPSAPSTDSGTHPDTGGTPPPPPGSPSPVPGPGVPPAPSPGNGGPDTPAPGLPGLPSTPPTVQSLTITGVHDVPVGKDAQLHAIATMSDGSQRDVTASSQWTTDNSVVAGIAQGGLLTALVPGSNVARANYNGTTASQPFTVTPF